MEMAIIRIKIKLITSKYLNKIISRCMKQQIQEDKRIVLRKLKKISILNNKKDRIIILKNIKIIAKHIKKNKDRQRKNSQMSNNRISIKMKKKMDLSNCSKMKVLSKKRIKEKMANQMKKAMGFKAMKKWKKRKKKNKEMNLFKKTNR